ncbi:hypothetical protein ADUPG1_004217, partial [Aduncisulcus paluster]
MHSNADISDISPLSALTSLEYLFLGGCDISVWGLTNSNGYALKTLSVPSTGLTDTQLISSTMQLYPHLSVLDISNNSAVSNIDGLANNVTTLTNVDLSNVSSAVSDLSLLLPINAGVASVNSILLNLGISGLTLGSNKPQLAMF